MRKRTIETVRDDLDAIEDMRPIVRSTAAFLIFLVRGGDVPAAYVLADVFFRQLEKDVTERADDRTP